MVTRIGAKRWAAAAVASTARQKTLAYRPNGPAFSRAQSDLATAPESVPERQADIGFPVPYSAQSPHKEDELRSLLRDCASLFAPGSPLASRKWLQRLENAESRARSTSSNVPPPIKLAIVGQAAAGANKLAELLRSDVLHSSARIDASANVASSQPSRLFKLAGSEVEIHELIDPNGDAEANLSALYACDLVLFLLDDVALAAHARFRTQLQGEGVTRLLRDVATKPGVMVLINHTGTQLANPDVLKTGLMAAISEDAYNQLTSRGASAVFDASLGLAERANTALQQAIASGANAQSSQSASDVDHYSTLYSTSGFASLRDALEAKSQSLQSNIEDDAALFTLRRALDQALFSIQIDLDHAQQARGAAQVLRQGVAKERARFIAATFNKESNESSNAAYHARTGDRSLSLEAARKDAWGIVEKTFATRLPWWKILWKVDDVRAETTSAIEQGFGKDLEQRLLVQTGRMASIAERLQRRVAKLFRGLDWPTAASQAQNDTGSQSPPNGLMPTRNPFRSPILLNELRKYSLDNVESSLSEDLLTRPIKARREQLLGAGGPVDVLCSRAQRTTVASVGLLSFSGLSSVAAGMAGSSFGVGLPITLQVIALQPTTAAAVFGFTGVLSLWIAQTRWTRAKRRFWRDWQRIADGLDADLESNLEQAFDRTVGASSLVAAQGLEQMAASYVSELAQTQLMLDAILAALRQHMANQSHPAASADSSIQHI